MPNHVQKLNLKTTKNLFSDFKTMNAKNLLYKE